MGDGCSPASKQIPNRTEEAFSLSESAVKTFFKLDPTILELASLFPEAEPLYLVGGAVRDLLMGRQPLDWDFTTAARPDQVKALLAKWADELWTTGERFGTISILKNGIKCEITTFRAEVYKPGNRKPKVSYSDTIEEDLGRRDFTINSVAYLIKDGALIDPFRGIRDLKEKILRTPGSVEQSFTDDPLRMMRAVSFHATLELGLSEDVYDGIARFGHLLKNISAERIRDEFSEILLAPRPSSALRLLYRSRLADHFLPEFMALAIPQPGGYHHKDVLEHTILVVEGVSPILPLRLGALVHDIGKPKTRNVVHGEVHFYQHEIVGADMAERILRRLKYSRKMIDMVTNLVRLHLRPHSYLEEAWTDRAVRRYIRDAGELLPLLNQLATADCTTMNPRVAARALAKQRELERRIERFLEEEDIRAMRPLLNGHQIMEAFDLAPGPAIGRIQKALLQAQIDGDIKSEEEAWELARRMHSEASGGEAASG